MNMASIKTSTGIAVVFSLLIHAVFVVHEIRIFVNYYELYMVSLTTINFTHC